MSIFDLNYADLTNNADRTAWMNAFKELETKVHDDFIVKTMSNNTSINKRVHKKPYTHLFITINPPPSYNLKDFLNTIQKTIKKNWIEGYLYVIEQRGENDEEIGKGFHTHILIKLIDHKRRSQIDREIKNTWKNILDVDNYHILNIKYIDDDEQKRKQKYMLSLKSEEVKHLKQKYDIIFRQKNNLQKFYFLDYNIEPELQYAS